MRILDLFCGAGGAAMGYHRAFPDAEIVGVDIANQPRYPFTFVQANAMTFSVDGFDLIHASPPCQHFTKYRNAVKDITDRYEDLLPATREHLSTVATPHVVENVEGAPLCNPITLCGSMFDLDVRRHRLFETNWDLPNHPWPCRHKIWGRRFKAATGRKVNSRFSIEIGSYDEPIALQRECMGVDWPMTLRELSEAIPPAYTQFIGEQFALVFERAA